MGKNSGRGRPNRSRAEAHGRAGRGGPGATPASAAPDEPAAAAGAGHRAAADETAALLEEIRQAAIDAEPALADAATATGGASELEHAWALYRSLAKRQTESSNALAAHGERMRAERADLDAHAVRRDAEAASLREEHDLLGARAELLDRREAELSDRERTAELRFAQRRVEADRELDVWLTGRRQELVEASAAERTTWQTHWAEAQQRLSEAQAGLDRRESELARRERDLSSERARVAEEQDDVAYLRAALKEQQAERDERIEREITRRTDRLIGETGELRRRVGVLTEGNERLNAQLAEQESALLALGGLSPDQVAQQLARLRSENGRLIEESAGAPRVDANTVGQLEQQIRRLVADNEELVRERGELETSLQRDRIAVNERQNYLEANNWLRAANGQLRQLLGEEAAKLNATAEAGKDGHAFPACSRMDREFAAAPSSNPQVPHLAELVGQMQAVIRRQSRLSYRASDLRLVLAGLAMSRLHLFQGISGIGKTGLGRALATAFGSPKSVAVVPVQSDWRDPQDLMGYYNSFDRMFYESEFTKALYRAQCPAFRDRPFFVVLDEMNLSHPEQYFSGVLSALSIKEEPRLALTTAPVRNPPELLVDGTHLAVPDNVWFIGTANHDETTVGFADKTYDRAFVLELPWQHPDLPVGPTEPPEPVAHLGLGQAFARAQDVYAAQATDVIDYLDRHWRGRFADELRIGWGNRLETQIKQFVPVVVAAGGSPGQALDHLVATRILRPVRGRYDIHADMLATLRTDLGDGLRAFDDRHEPAATERLLADEIRARGPR